MLPSPSLLSFYERALPLLTDAARAEKDGADSLLAPRAGPLAALRSDGLVFLVRARRRARRGAACGAARVW